METTSSLVDQEVIRDIRSRMMERINKTFRQCHLYLLSGLRRLATKVPTLSLLVISKMKNINGYNERLRRERSRNRRWIGTD
jgi:hypothetical protein